MKKTLIVLLMAGLFTACHRHEHENTSTGHSHAGGDELLPLSFTKYTDSTELFEIGRAHV